MLPSGQPLWAERRQPHPRSPLNSVSRESSRPLTHGHRSTAAARERRAFSPLQPCRSQALAAPTHQVMVRRGQKSLHSQPGRRAFREPPASGQSRTSGFWRPLSHQWRGRGLSSLFQQSLGTAAPWGTSTLLSFSSVNQEPSHAASSSERPLGGVSLSCHLKGSRQRQPSRPTVLLRLGSSRGAYCSWVPEWSCWL